MNEKITNRLLWLNTCNHTSDFQMKCIDELTQTFPEPIIALEVGSAYGGGVEMMAKLLKDRGFAYGYDTFEGHPKDLSVDPTSVEAICMDMW